MHRKERPKVLANGSTGTPVVVLLNHPARRYTKRSFQSMTRRASAQSIETGHVPGIAVAPFQSQNSRKMPTV